MKIDHICHVEDLILSHGSSGGLDVLRVLYSILNTLKQQEPKAILTTKWDGSPSVFAGTDPADGSLFVATKAIFNSNPVVYKSLEEIDNAPLVQGLKTKLKHVMAFNLANPIEGVVQGDYLFENADLSTMDIDGKPHITFHPNTIVYAVSVEDESSKGILAAKFGVAWHTRYRGKTLSSIHASIREEVSVSDPQGTIWSPSVTWKPTHPVDYKAADAAILEAALQMVTVDRGGLDYIAEHPDLLMIVLQMVNRQVRAGKWVSDPTFGKQLREMVEQHFIDEMAIKKTDRGRDAVSRRKADAATWFMYDIWSVFRLYSAIAVAKLEILKALNDQTSIKTFLVKNDGQLKETKHEGFVAHVLPLEEGGSSNQPLSVKLVDRLQFSVANFARY